MKRLLLTTEYPADRLRAHPLNYRQHDLEALKRALERGQHRTVAVMADDPEDPLAGGMLLAGHGVWYASRELGREHVAATVVTCSAEEAEEIVVEDNRAQELGANNPGKLADLMDRLLERDRLAFVGYTVDDHEAVLAAAGRNLTPPEEFRGGFAETAAETAARSGGEGRQVDPIRQVMLIFPDGPSYADFQRRLGVLRDSYQLEEGGTTALVCEAVARESARG